jgi:3',5'-cyclic AMP phosphodiesterase CpdA
MLPERGIDRAACACAKDPAGRSSAALIRLAHISDVHVQVEAPWTQGLRGLGWRRALAQVELVGLGRARRFRDAERSLARAAAAASASGADHVVITGDFTGVALEEEFQRAKAALGALAGDPSRLSVIPGNHDRYTFNAARERRFERHFGPLLRSDLPRFVGPSGYPFVRMLGREGAVIGLDSTRLAPFPGLAFGQLGREQLGRLSALLEAPELRGRFLSVLVHHAPLVESGRPDSRTHGLRDGASLLRVLAGRPCSVHHGHVHRRFWLRATGSRPDLFNAGSSTMCGREGFWIVELDADGVLAAKELGP